MGSTRSVYSKRWIWFVGITSRYTSKRVWQRWVPGKVWWPASRAWHPFKFAGLVTGCGGHPLFSPHHGNGFLPRNSENRVAPRRHKRHPCRCGWFCGGQTSVKDSLQMFDTKMFSHIKGTNNLFSKFHKWWCHFSVWLSFASRMYVPLFSWSTFTDSLSAGESGDEGWRTAPF